MKYCSKFLVSSICQTIFITYIKKLITTIAHKVSIKFWQSINEGLFKVEYLTKLSQFLKHSKGSHEVTQQKNLE